MHVFCGLVAIVFFLTPIVAGLYLYCRATLIFCTYSKEGVMQGDPLSMFMYAIGTLPLIYSLRNPAQWTQIWYADDASVCGYLKNIHEWFSELCSRGPDFGYFPELSKCFLLVNNEFRPDAKRSFGTLGVRIVTGHHFLGGFLGDHSRWIQYVSGYGSGFTVPYKGC